MKLEMCSPEIKSYNLGVFGICCLLKEQNLERPLKAR